MSRTYQRNKCFYCGKNHSSNGLATVNHMRKHVREGTVVEVLDQFGYYAYQAVKIEAGQVVPDLDNMPPAP